ncbi:uncharacterized protein [Chamaea fasciata]|uniref:uncharacterized protein n=1 Tax=Chamaea fasciata TaxID=190680 RepID=UPI00336A1E07
MLDQPQHLPNLQQINTPPSLASPANRGKASPEPVRPIRAARWFGKGKARLIHLSWQRPTGSSCSDVPPCYRRRTRAKPSTLAELRGSCPPRASPGCAAAGAALCPRRVPAVPGSLSSGAAQQRRPGRAPGPPPGRARVPPLPLPATLAGGPRRPLHLVVGRRHGTSALERDGGRLISGAASVPAPWTRHSSDMLTPRSPAKPPCLLSLLPGPGAFCRQTNSSCLDFPFRRAAAAPVSERRALFAQPLQVPGFCHQIFIVGTHQAPNQWDLLNSKAWNSLEEQTFCHWTKCVHFCVTASTSSKTKPLLRHLQCPQCSAASKQDPRNF